MYKNNDAIQKLNKTPLRTGVLNYILNSITLAIKDSICIYIKINML